MSIIWTHPIRIYRNTLTRQHDLSLVLSCEDIYAEDKWGRLLRDMDAGVMEFGGPSEFGIVETPAKLVVPDELDIRPGYFVQVKTPRVVEGIREACATYLRIAAVATDTTIYVDDTYGMKAGMQFLLNDGTNNQLVAAKTINDESLVLHSDCALLYAFAVDTPVTACHFYRVVGQMTPHDGGPLRVLSMVEMLGTRGMG